MYGYGEGDSFSAKVGHLGAQYQYELNAGISPCRPDTDWCREPSVSPVIVRPEPHRFPSLTGTPRFASPSPCVDERADAPAEAARRAMLPAMSTDTKWILGTMIGTWVGLLTVVVTLNGGVRADIRDVSADLRDVRTDLRDVRTDLGDRMDRIESRLDGFDDRLRAVEIAFGKVDQRLATLERAIIPAAGVD